MRRLFHFLGCVWYYVWGRIFSVLNPHKDKKYISGRWFADGIHSLGWRWVCKDTIECIKHNSNRAIPWPVSPNIKIAFPNNIHFHVDDLNDFQGFGCYFQAFADITIGRGTYIANNVGLITANHDFYDLDKHQEAKPIVLGEGCWIGMNAIILPGVTLGNQTIVGAGAVVTKSFAEGHCVIGGNPAKVLKVLN